MSFGGISFGGLGSGLDTAAIISALVNVERIPINQLTASKNQTQKKIDVLGTFQGHVKALRDKADSLATLSKFLNFSVGMGDETIATITANGSAVAGSHTIDVQRLASVDRWAFDGVLDPDAQLNGSGSEEVLSFTYDGVTYDIPTDGTNSSLNQIASAVSLATNGAVSATVVNSGTTTSPSYQMVLAGNDTGEDYRISSISSGIAGLTITYSPPDAAGGATSLNNVTVGSNAVAIIDGLSIQRSDNDFSDVLPGISIDLLTAGSTSFTVEPDKEQIKDSLQGFVDAYNEVIGFINEQSKYSEDDGAGGALFGDSSLRTIQGALRSTLFSQTVADITGDVAGYGTLRLVGIELASDGKLSINQSVMDEKMNTDMDAFADLFVDLDGFDNGGAAVGTPGFYIDTTADSGLMDDLVRRLDQITKGYDDGAGNFYKGLFDSRNESLNKAITDYNARIDDKEFRLERFEENLVARFTALETLMAQLQSQSGFLNAIGSQNQ